MENGKRGVLPASYLVLIKDNKILLQRRFNTGYEDGKYSFVAGHVESMEEARKPILSIIRETKEEIGIKLSEDEFYVLGKTKLKKAKKYKIIEEDLLKEGEISKKLGFDTEPPHLVLLFVSFLKENDRISFGNELDKFEKVKIDGLDRYKITPITKIMVERFLKLSNSNII